MYNLCNDELLADDTLKLCVTADRAGPIRTEDVPQRRKICKLKIEQRCLLVDAIQ